MPVSLPVLQELRTPVFDPALGKVGLWTTGVLMPKAALHLNDLLQSRENQIWPAGERVDVKSVTKAHPVHEPPDGHFGRRVLASDAPHVLASPLW
jgi:hypothetical protein